MTPRIGEVWCAWKGAASKTEGGADWAPRDYGVLDWLGAAPFSDAFPESAK